LAQAELAPQREALAQEQAELKADLVRAQAENDEAVRVLEVQLENQAAQLAEAASKDQAAQARLAELAENLGYLKAKLEAAEGAEAAARQQLKDKDAQVVKLEAQLQEAERSLREQVQSAKAGSR
jgi:chromosome segregation ATPase